MGKISRSFWEAYGYHDPEDWNQKQPEPVSCGMVGIVWGFIITTIIIWKVW